jgi:hypothetical protein
LSLLGVFTPFVKKLLTENETADGGKELPGLAGRAVDERAENTSPGKDDGGTDAESDKKRRTKKERVEKNLEKNRVGRPRRSGDDWIKKVISMPRETYREIRMYTVEHLDMSESDVVLLAIREFFAKNAKRR